MPVDLPPPLLGASRCPQEHPTSRTGPVLIEFTRAQVRDDESWAQAADRLAGGRGPVLAVDLSGDPLRFCVDDEHRFAMRPMTEGDLPDLTRWINAPHVARWWDEHRTPEQVAAHYGRASGRGRGPLLGLGGQRALRRLQPGLPDLRPSRVRAAVRPPRCDRVRLRDRGGGLGRPGPRHQPALGLPARHRRPGVRRGRRLFAAPDHRNARSLRVLAKLGATEGMWFDEPQSDGGVDTVVGCSIDVQRVLRWA